MNNILYKNWFNLVIDNSLRELKLDYNKELKNYNNIVIVLKKRKGLDKYLSKFLIYLKKSTIIKKELQLKFMKIWELIQNQFNLGIIIYIYILKKKKHKFFMSNNFSKLNSFFNNKFLFNANYYKKSFYNYINFFSLNKNSSFLKNIGLNCWDLNLISFTKKSKKRIFYPIKNLFYNKREAKHLVGLLKKFRLKYKRFWSGPNNMKNLSFIMRKLNLKYSMKDFELFSPIYRN